MHLITLPSRSPLVSLEMKLHLHLPCMLTTLDCAHGYKIGNSILTHREPSTGAV